MLLPYLELPVAIGYAHGDEKQEDKIVKGKFQPSMISHYHEGFYDIGIFIYIQGSPIQIAMSIEQYEATIIAYWNKLNTEANAQNEKKSIKQKLGIVN